MTYEVDAVVFDAVGTLMYADPPVAVAYANVGRQFGSRLEPEQVRTRFHAAFARQEQADHATGDGAIDEQHERRRWQHVVADVFNDVAETAELFEALWSHFAQPEHWALYPDVGPSLAALRQQGLTLAIGSNFDARLHAVCRGHLSLAAIDRLFISSERGYRKPHSEFFRGIATEVAIAPQRLLLVGDDLENDYRGAQSAGWQALLLDRQATAPAPGTIKTLADLLTLLH